MSFKEPVKVIDHIPKNFDLNAKPKRDTVLSFLCFFGALATVVSALVKGVWK